MDLRKIYSVPLDDELTWNMICAGKCIGGFQIESPLLRTWCKRLAPRSIEDLAAVLSVVRPGVLDTLDADGERMIEVYRKSKLGLQEPKYIHESLKKHLVKTAGVMIYQEQLMAIAADIGNFSLLEVDMLRKAVGKKDYKEISRVRNIFIEKATNHKIVDEEIAKKIYDSFEASGRYLFNKAHAVEYAVLSYRTMYEKANRTKQFFTGWLRLSPESPNFLIEMSKLIGDAKQFSIDVLPPDITKGNGNFEIIGDSIYFGLLNIAGIGEAQVTKIANAIQEAMTHLNKEFASFSELELLFELKISPSIFAKLILCGAFRHFTSDRKRVVHTLKNLEALPAKTYEYCATQYMNYKNLNDLLFAAAKPKKEGGGASRSDMIPKILSILDIIENPPISLKDTSDEIARFEADLLGSSITCSRLDKFANMKQNSTISEFLKGKNEQIMCFAIELLSVRPYTMNKGQNVGKTMAFLNIQDQTGSCDAIIFSDVYDMLTENNLLYEGSRMLAQGKKSNQGDSLIIETATILRNE